VKRKIHEGSIPHAIENTVFADRILISRFFTHYWINELQAMIAKNVRFSELKLNSRLLFRYTIFCNKFSTNF
jgi:hypothetical protein